MNNEIVEMSVEEVNLITGGGEALVPNQVEEQYPEVENIPP
jgi:hypothetical protein